MHVRDYCSGRSFSPFGLPHAHACVTPPKSGCAVESVRAEEPAQRMCVGDSQSIPIVCHGLRSRQHDLWRIGHACARVTLLTLHSSEVLFDEALISLGFEPRNGPVIINSTRNAFLLCRAEISSSSHHAIAHPRCHRKMHRVLLAIGMLRIQKFL